MSKIKKSYNYENEEKRSIDILNKDSIEIKYNNEYEIKLIPEIGLFKIQIKEINKSDLFQYNLDQKNKKNYLEVINQIKI